MQLFSIEEIYGIPSFRSSYRLLNNFKFLKISNGSSISFWKDAWCDSGIPLMDLFPRLYALKTNKECKVRDRWRLCNGVWGGVWSWRIPLRGRPIDDLVKMVDILGNLFFSSNGVDKWAWSSDVSGMCKVKVHSHYIPNSVFFDCIIGEHHVWNSWIPRKVNVCVWRASINRLATRSNLAARGVSLSSTLCPFCVEENEDIEHCLI
ncbi:RNA-directed DNA polymerase, eukaryota, reverse transcriptase zinc-binding domain protein [Tanacetum coccineum]